MNNIKSLDLLIRYFAWGIFEGGVVLLAGLVLGLLHVIPVGWSLGMGSGGILMSAMCLREVQRGRRLRAKRLQSSEALTQHDTANP